MASGGGEFGLAVEEGPGWGWLLQISGGREGLWVLWVIFIYFFCGEEGITDDFLMGDEEFLQMSMVL